MSPRVAVAATRALRLFSGKLLRLLIKCHGATRALLSAELLTAWLSAQCGLSSNAERREILSSPTSRASRRVRLVLYALHSFSLSFCFSISISPLCAIYADSERIASHSYSCCRPLQFQKLARQRRRRLTRWHCECHTGGPRSCQVRAAFANRLRISFQKGALPPLRVIA